MIKSATNYDVCSIAEKLLYCTTPSFVALTVSLTPSGIFTSLFQLIKDRAIRKFYKHTHLADLQFTSNAIHCRIGLQSLRNI